MGKRWTSVRRVAGQVGTPLSVAAASNNRVAIEFWASNSGSQYRISPFLPSFADNNGATFEINWQSYPVRFTLERHGTIVQSEWGIQDVIGNLNGVTVVEVFEEESDG